MRRRPGGPGVAVSKEANAESSTQPRSPFPRQVFLSEETMLFSPVA